MYINNITNIFPIVNRCNSLVFKQFCGVFFTQLLEIQLFFCAIINIMKTLKPAPVAGFGVYNGLRLTAIELFEWSITLLVQNCKNPKSGVSNISLFYYLQILQNLLKNCKAFPRTTCGMISQDFLPTNVRLETSLCRILEARGGCNGRLLYFTPSNFCRIVNLTPVRYNGGQLYNFGHYYPKTPVIL